MSFDTIVPWFHVFFYLYFTSLSPYDCNIYIGIVISILMAVCLRPHRPPHWGMLVVLVSLAFVMSIVWLNIIASEVVGVLTALGLLLNIKTGQNYVLRS